MWRNRAGGQLVSRDTMLPQAAVSLVRQAAQTQRTAIQIISFDDSSRYSMHGIAFGPQAVALVCRRKSDVVDEDFYQTFIHRIVHDMRNPLAAIIANASNLQQSPTMEAEEYVLRFCDNGEGIPPEFLPERIFQPLVRARSQGAGSGLGFSIVRKIVESQLAKSTTVTIQLPRFQEQPV